MENGRKTKDSQMVGDYGVEEWRDGGTLCSLSGFFNQISTRMVTMANDCKSYNHILFVVFFLPQKKFH